jgi:hypothetical protein
MKFDVLVDGLIKRFHMPNPENFSSRELADWRKRKLEVVQAW